MFNNLLTLPKAYLRFALVRGLLLFTLFTGLALTTVFIGVFLLDMQLHWNPLYIIATCLGPWLLAFIILAIMTKRASDIVQFKKNNPITMNRNSLIYQVASIAMLYFSRRKRKK